MFEDFNNLKSKRERKGKENAARERRLSTFIRLLYCKFDESTRRQRARRGAKLRRTSTLESHSRRMGQRIPFKTTLMRRGFKLLLIVFPSLFEHLCIFLVSSDRSAYRFRNKADPCQAEEVLFILSGRKLVNGDNEILENRAERN